MGDAQNTAEAYNCRILPRKKLFILKIILTNWEYLYFFLYMRKHEINSHNLTKTLLVSPVWPSFSWDSLNTSPALQTREQSAIFTLRATLLKVYKTSVTYLLKNTFSQKISFQFLFFNVYFNFATERRAQAHGYSDVSQTTREISQQLGFQDFPTFS